MLAVRKEAIERREYWLAAQKQAGAARDGELAKFCKEEWKKARRDTQAACLLLGWVHEGTDLPGDCVSLPIKEWPLDLTPHIDDAVESALAIEWRKHQRIERHKDGSLLT
jgi:hypothetical protein